MDDLNITLTTRREVQDLQRKQRELADVESKLVEVAALEESGVLQLEADAQAAS